MVENKCCCFDRDWKRPPLRDILLIGPVHTQVVYSEGIQFATSQKNNNKIVKARGFERGFERGALIRVFISGTCKKYIKNLSLATIHFCYYYYFLISRYSMS